ncbi:MAG: PfkB family carbohydrate kinase, partial [Bacteroidota bacterium]
MPKHVVLYGEMLWDCLPTGAVPGGAPMNVALHLHQVGRATQLISAVGKDPEGEALLDFLRSFKLPMD